MSADTPVRSLLRRLIPRFHLGGRRLPSLTSTTRLALVLITVQMVVRIWATSRSWFMWDDYIFLADVARDDTGWAWLFHSHFSLVQPVAFAIVWAIGGVGLSWAVIGSSIVVLQLLTSLTCWWMLRTLFGNRRLIVLPLLFFLFVPLTAPATVWWSVAIYQYPHQIAIFGSVTVLVLYLRSGRWYHLVSLAAFVALGLGSYLKAPLIVLVLMGVGWLWFTDGALRRRIGQLARMWPAWLVSVALTAGYVLLWSSKQTGAPIRRNCELPGVLQNSMLDTLGPATVGGPFNWRLWTGGIDPLIDSSSCVPQAYRGFPELVVGGAPQSLTAPPLTVIILSWLLITALVVHRWARHRDAMRSLWIVGPYVLLSALLVFAGRAGTWGAQISAREVRYFSDVAVIITLALATALMPIIGARVAVRAREEPFITVGLSRTTIVTLVSIFVVGSLGSTLSYVRPWHNTVKAEIFPERVFVQQVEDSVRNAPSGPVRIADVPLPVTIANPVIYPYNLPSRKLTPLDSRLDAVQQGTDLQVLDADGRIRPAMIEDGPRAANGPVKNCGYLVQSFNKRISVIPVVAGSYWARIDYLASDDGAMTVVAGTMSRRIEIEKGLHQMFFQTEGAFTSVWLQTGDPSLSVCVDNLHVGPVEPKEPVP